MSATRPWGRGMSLVFWVLALVMATYFFAQYEERQNNPNPEPLTVLNNGQQEVVLRADRYGHFVASGRINGEPVVFLVDTGATQVALSAQLAKRLHLDLRGQRHIETASGVAQGQQVFLRRLQLGSLVLQDVPALVIDGMSDDRVLLGMSVLKHLEFTQRAGTLTLRPPLSEHP